MKRFLGARVLTQLLSSRLPCGPFKSRSHGLADDPKLLRRFVIMRQCLLAPTTAGITTQAPSSPYEVEWLQKSGPMPPGSRHLRTPQFRFYPEQQQYPTASDSDRACADLRGHPQAWGQ